MLFRNPDPTCPAAGRLLAALLLPLAALAATAQPHAATGETAPAPADSPALALEPGDHICLVGNTLAERMQHFGWFETLLHATLPDHELTVRNLAWSADEVGLRPRPGEFGDTTHHLTRQQADVVIAFFGFNESFAGEAGLDTFRRDLAEFLTTTSSQGHRDGATSTRVVLVGPIAATAGPGDVLEPLDQLNTRISLYNQAMADVAHQHDVPFIDLFDLTRQLHTQSEPPLTINGIHLSSGGYRELAPHLLRTLLGREPVAPDDPEPLRAEILARNHDFFYAYRPVNSYYIHGGRSQLSHEPDRSFTNADVMNRERDIFEQMTANRDRRIWQLAAGHGIDPEPSHDNLPEAYRVESNFTEPIEYLTGEEALAGFTLPDGYRIELFACEERFPELVNPVAIEFDGHGRLWVSTMPLFPQRGPHQQPEGRLLVFEDRTGDGKADHMTVFADRLHVVTGFELGDGGVYLAAQPDLKFLADTTGDGVADVRERILHGFDTADCHHAISSFTWGPDGALYFQEGIFHHTQVETRHGPRRLRHGGVFRHVPQRGQLDVFIGYTFPNPWGHVFDRWGMNIVSDGTGPLAMHAGLLSGRLTYPDMQQDGAPALSVGIRPNGACELVSSRHFPPEVQGHYLQTNVTGFHGIRQFELRDQGAGIEAVHVHDLLTSDDPSFRPIDLKFGPDGALYLSDFHSRLIGHMTHSLRDPNRLQDKGRIYRIVHQQRPLLEAPSPAIADRDVAGLLELLDAPEDRTVYRARRQLREHSDDQVLPAVTAWLDALDPAHPEFDRLRLEALWLQLARNQLPDALWDELFQSDDHRIRAALVRALRHHLHLTTGDGAARRLLAAATDPHPRVRLEAVVASGWLEQADARRVIELAASAGSEDPDPALTYAIEAALRWWDGSAVAEPSQP